MTIIDKKPPLNKQQSETNVRSIEHFPVTVFGGALGIAGLGIVWRAAESALNLPPTIHHVILWFAMGYIIAVTSLYLIKTILFREHVIADFHNPIRNNFISTVPLGIMLMSFGLQDILEEFSKYLWLLAAVATIVLGNLSTSFWLRKSRDLKQLTPAVFIPTVGVLIGPITGADYSSDEGFRLIAWFMLGIGSFMWLGLFPITLYRLYFGEALNPSLRPSLTVLIAPPALLAMAYTRMQGGIMADIGFMLTGMSLFIALLLIFSWKIHKKTPFSLSWWGYTFPISALGTACFSTYEATQITGMLIISLIVLTFTSIMTLYVTYRTLLCFALGHLFRTTLD